MRYVAQQGNMLKWEQAEVVCTLIEVEFAQVKSLRNSSNLL